MMSVLGHLIWYFSNQMSHRTLFHMVLQVGQNSEAWGLCLGAKVKKQRSLLLPCSDHQYADIQSEAPEWNLVCNITQNH